MKVFEIKESEWKSIEFPREWEWTSITLHTGVNVCEIEVFVMPITVASYCVFIRAQILILLLYVQERT